MKAYEFKELANVLTHKHFQKCEEGKNRTIISRYYYYIFLKIRDEIILNYDMNPETKDFLTSPKAHGLLRKYIREVSKKSLKLYGTPIYQKEQLHEIAIFLGQLHKQRKDADYEVRKTIDANDVNSALEKVQEIEQRLDLLEKFLEALKKFNKLPKLKA